jgi:hypothetical protein
MEELGLFVDTLIISSSSATLVEVEKIERIKCLGLFNSTSDTFEDIDCFLLEEEYGSIYHMVKNIETLDPRIKDFFLYDFIQ